MFCYFVSDLHGYKSRWEKLFDKIIACPPEIVFIGGDFLPAGIGQAVSADFSHQDFIEEFLGQNLERTQKRLGDRYPKIYIIMGNDDGRFQEEAMKRLSNQNLCSYIHGGKDKIDKYAIYGYSYIPPSPFQLKDWERYDVSRYTDPGAVSPEKGIRSVAISANKIKYATIGKDLEVLAKDDDLTNSIMLFHTPPYKTNLDRADLDGKKIDHVPVDVHVGSIAVYRFIEKRQPLLTLHGHVHESTRLTGSWRDRIGRTYCFNAAHDGVELALIKFDLEKLEKAERMLL